MINRALNFSIADRITAAKTSSTNMNDTSAVPNHTNAKPGNTTLTADTGQIDQAGSNVQAKSNEANAATSNAKVNQNLQGAKDQTYTGQKDAEFPKEKDPAKQTPKPQNKTFTERLLDKQIASKMHSNKPDNATSNTEYPKGQTEGINRPQPEDNSPSRQTPQPFNPGDVTTPTSQAPSGDVLGSVPTGRPGVNLGPSWTATSPKSFRPSSLPKPKFK
jgi:hypothetical protein